MNWLPPIGVSRVSDGGKVIPMNIERKSAFLILNPEFMLSIMEIVRYSHLTLTLERWLQSMDLESRPVGLGIG